MNAIDEADKKMVGEILLRASAQGTTGAWELQFPNQLMVFPYKSPVQPAQRKGPNDEMQKMNKNLTTTGIFKILTLLLLSGFTDNFMICKGPLSLKKHYSEIFTVLIRNM